MEIKNLPLTADMVEVRLAQIQSTQYGYYGTLLLYQDGRASMNALDVLYPGWQRTHQILGNEVYCTIRVFDSATNSWIERQDVGTSGQIEAEKSKASDSFKRAAVNFIPAFRALYNAPEIRFKLDDSEVSTGAGSKPKCYTKFNVSKLEYDEANKVFTSLVIIDNNGVIRYDLSKQGKTNVKVEHSSQPALVAGSGANSAKTSVQQDLVCSHCGSPVSEKVKGFSIHRYGKCLCMKCQKGVGA